MKPAPFEYFAPTSLVEAVSLLAQYGYDAKLLAGGQSLIPAMNFRLAQPGVLIDLNLISTLAYIQTTDDGLHLGAMTRQVTIEHSREVARDAPLLHAAMPAIAHVQIRNRGTLGGSLAHNDPAAELPAIMVTLGATMQIEGPQGARTLPAAKFSNALFAANIDADEVLSGVTIPPLPPGTGWGFHEVTRRHGDFALVGAAATVTLDEVGRCTQARLVYFGVGETPTPADRAMQALMGETLTPDILAAAAQTAAAEELDPPGDIHASAAFRRHLAQVVGKRVLAEAVARAKE